MGVPITTMEEERARFALVEKRLRQGETDDIQCCEESLDDLKDILTFWRRYQQQVERQRHDYPLEKYRALRRHIKRAFRAAKAVRYHHLVLQDLNLQRASLEAATLEEPMDRNKADVEVQEVDRDTARDLYLEYMIQYIAWKDPQKGAVSPAVRAFFEANPPDEPGYVGFARWLMIGHESDGGHTYYLRAEDALALVQALGLGDAAEVPEMRRVIREAAALRRGGEAPDA